MQSIWTMIKIFSLLVLLFLLLFIVLILFATLTDYKPDEVTTVESVGNSKQLIESDSLSFLIWNIGYGGLGKDSDFFYDGGQMVIPKPEWTKQNLDGIETTLKRYKDTDFILLQEVDWMAKRSHNTNEVKAIHEILNPSNYAFGVNYKVSFIPIPPNNPLGGVKSGLVSYSRYLSEENTRYQFPGNFSWPKSLYFLDRCFLLQRYRLRNKKDLVVINTHNSAYDDGSLKQQQMEYLKKKLEEEYDKGNYVIVGGDWNQTPPGYDNNTFVKEEGSASEQIPIPFDYMPEGWVWAYDASVATNRKLDKVYDPLKTFTTVIDFYLLSPNLQLLKAEGIDLDFQYSDHQPVFIKVALK